MSDDDRGCARCGKAEHEARKCKAPFRKAWPGKPAMVVKLRDANGFVIELTAEIDDNIYASARALTLAAWKRGQ